MEISTGYLQAGERKPKAVRRHSVHEAALKKHGRCTAKSRTRGGAQCLQPNAPGAKKCRYHGGAAGSGRPVQHGRYSIKATGTLGAFYRDALATGRLLEMEDPLALLDAIVMRRLEQVEALDTAGFRAQALGLYRSARSTDDPTETFRILRGLGDLLERGADEASALQSLSDELKRRLEATKDANQVALARSEVVRRRDVQMVLARMAQIMREETEPRISSRILDRWDRELAAAAAATVPASEVIGE